jgi:hypothetical protein
VATLKLNEFARAPHPHVVATRGDRRVTAQLRRVQASIAGFGLRMVFPTEGRGRLAVVAEKRRFALPALDVGSGEAPQDYVAFPKGSAPESAAATKRCEAPRALRRGRGGPPRPSPR